MAGATMLFVAAAMIAPAAALSLPRAPTMVQQLPRAAGLTVAPALLQRRSVALLQRRSCSPLMLAQREESARAAGPLSAVRGAVPRIASVTLAVASFILCRSARAFAATSGVAIKTDPVEMVKIGVGVGGAAVACAVLVLKSRKTSVQAIKSAQREQPTAEVVAPAVDDDVMLLGSLQSRMESLYSGKGETTEPAAAAARPSAEGRGSGAVLEPPAAASAATPVSDLLPVDQAFLADDSLVMGDLAKRMRELAEAAAREPEPPVDDSTTEWGQGTTAVLEPPREDRPAASADDKPAVDFPAGFPLRDFANEPVDDKPPAPSESEIAMLKRMFGTAD